MPTKKTPIKKTPIKKNIEKFERIKVDFIDPIIEAKIYERCETQEQYIDLLYESIKINPEKLENIDLTKTHYENFESVYTDEKNKYLDTLEFNDAKPEAVKGLKPCKGSPGKPCGCDEFYIWSAQTRSADEGTTNFEKCKECGKRRRGD